MHDKAKGVRKLASLLILLTAGTAAIPRGPTLAQDGPPPPLHPRILFSPEDLGEFRARIDKEPWRPAWKRLERLCQAATEAESPANQFLHAVARKKPEVADKFVARAFHSALYNSLAYMFSRDDAYGVNAGDLLTQVARFYPADELDWEERRCNLAAFALAYDWTVPALTEEAARDLQGTLAVACQRSYEKWQEGKAPRPTVLDGSPFDPKLVQRAARLGLAALALEAEPPYSPDWLNAAVNIVRRYLLAGVTSEGVVLAGAPHALFGMDEVALFIHALRLRNIDLLSERLGRVPEWLLYETSPWPYELGFGGREPRSYWAGSFLSLIASGFGKGGRAALERSYQWDGGLGLEPAPLPILLWADPERGPGSPPSLPLDRHFGTGGGIHFRSGWSPGDVAIAIRADPIAHADAVGAQGSFTLAGYGAHLVTELAQRERSPQAFNGILIDGKPQAAGEGLDTEALVRDYVSCRFAAAARLDLKPAFDSAVGRSEKRKRLVRKTHLSVLKAQRTFLFIRGEVPPYLILADDFDKDGVSHTYGWQLRTAEGHLVQESEEEELKNWAFILQPSGKSHLACARGTEGGKAAFGFTVPIEGDYWGWLLLRGEMPFGPSVPASPESSNRPHPAASSWTWKRIPFHKDDPTKGVTLGLGKKDLVLQGNHVAWVARCLLSRSAEFIPQGADPVFKDRSILLTPKDASVTAPWRKVENPGGGATLSLLVAGPPRHQLGVYQLPDQVGCPILKVAAKGRHGRFATILIPGNAQTLSPTFAGHSAKSTGSFVSLEWVAEDEALKVTDSLLFAADKAFSEGGLGSDAQIAFRRHGVRGKRKWQKTVMIHGTFLEIDEKRIADGFGVRFSMIDDGRAVQIQGRRLTSLKLHLPEPRRVIVNGEERSFVIDEDGFALVRISATVIPELNLRGGEKE